MVRRFALGGTPDGPGISRRGFLAFTGAASSVALLAPRQFLAQDDGLVQMARRSAASSNITVQKLRGKISVLMGAGGNIAVLPGPDGKLLIDAGFASSRPKLTDALASIKPSRHDTLPACSIATTSPPYHRDPLLIESSSPSTLEGICRVEAARFSRRCSSEDVPGISRILGER